MLSIGFIADNTTLTIINLWLGYLYPSCLSNMCSIEISLEQAVVCKIFVKRLITYNFDNLLRFTSPSILVILFFCR